MPPVHLSGASPALTEKEWVDKYRFFSNLPADNRRCTEECRFFDKMKGDVAGPVATGETSRFVIMNQSRQALRRTREEEQKRGVQGPLDQWTPEDRKHYSYDSVFSRLEGYLIHSNKTRDERLAAWRRSMAVESKQMPYADTGVQVGDSLDALTKSQSMPAL